MLELLETRQTNDQQFDLFGRAADPDSDEAPVDIEPIASQSTTASVSDRLMQINPDELNARQALDLVYELHTLAKR
jgi:hypothetical protein